jgi:hypothetical protein
MLLAIDYEELYIPNAYKLDLMVENRLVLELKSLDPMPPVYFKQIKTQLSLLNLKHGMLLNLKVELMKHGIHRIFNNFGRESINRQPVQNLSIMRALFNNFECKAVSLLFSFNL